MQTRGAYHAGQMVETTCPTVLVVDDDPEVARVVCSLLNWSGDFLALSESDSAAALALFDRVQVDLLVLDMRMPGLDGGELFTLLRGHPATARLPILFLTAMEPEDVAEHVHDWRHSRILTKPFRPQALISSVHALLAEAAVEVAAER